MINSKSKRSKKGGFTLIELVIVLAIMAVIALIAIPNFNSVKESSKVKADRQSAESIKRTVQLLIVDDTLKITADKDLTYDANNKTIGGADTDNTEVLKDALSYVNPPATNSDAPYEIKIKNNGNDVIVSVKDKPGTSTDGTGGSLE